MFSSNKFRGSLDRLKEIQAREDAISQAEKAKTATSIDSINTDLAELDKKIDAYNKKYGSNSEIEKAKGEALEHKTELEDIKKEQERNSQLRNVVLETDEDLKKKKEDIDKKEEVVKDVGNQFDGLGSTLNDSSDIFDKLSDSLSGEVSVGDMAKTADTLNKGYDNVLKDTVKATTGSDSTAFIEAWARNEFGDKLYEAASAIKNGAGTAISGIDSLMGLGDTFGGNWRDPKADAEKIAKGIGEIQNAVTGISQVANNIFMAVTQNDQGSVILGQHLNIKNNIVFNSAGKLAGTTALGIGSVAAFRNGDITGGLRGIGTTIGSLKDAVTGIGNWKIKKEKGELEEKINRKIKTGDFDSDNTRVAFAGGKNETSSILTHSDEGRITGAAAHVEMSDAISGDEDYGADMINEVNVVIDGASCSDISCCVINGVKYKCSSYSLSQEMLNPMILSFIIEKFNKEETQQDVVFADATQTIGKTLEMNATTIKTSSQNAKVQKAFVFKGMIVDVSASRVTASAQSASITAASWDCLLQTAPHCRSFESLTLEEIVKKVLEPYGEIKSIVKPRMKKSIPYVVQYNQSDYAFLRMLAARFGEWMYSTGEKFIFGDMEELGSTAEMEYPGGSLLSYHLNQHTTPFAFNHLLTDHYKYGSSSDILKKPGLHVADGNVNEWTDRAYLASQKRYTNQRMEMLETGGFDNWKSEEGIDTIIDYSLKIEAEGMKTNLMSVQGSSKLAMLKVAQPMLICDSVQNKSGENQDVKQKVLRILGINHSFDYHQEYSNTFTAIPMGCKYPAYSNPSLHPIAPLQRARVTDNEDKQKLGRIRVQFPWQEIQDKEMKTPWLRLVTPYAGGEKGHLFVPEIGEEVIVGFEMDNAERPYIIGALYNGGKGKPDEKWAASNNEKGTKDNIKAIRTRGGHTILFNDRGDRGLLEIYDNKGNTYHITLSADDKKITICSAGDIEINADGSITMNARNDIKMNANKEITIQAAKVKVR